MGFIEFLNVPHGTLSHPTWQEDLVPSPAYMISDKYACLIQEWRDSSLSWSKCAVICDTEDFPANAAADAKVREGGCAYAHSLWSVLQLKPTGAWKAHSAEGIVKSLSGLSHFTQAPWMPTDCRDFALRVSLVLSPNQAADINLFQEKERHLLAENDLCLQ